MCWGKGEGGKFRILHIVIVGRGFNRNYVDVIPEICFLVVSIPLIFGLASQNTGLLYIGSATSERMRLLSGQKGLSGFLFV